MQKNIENELEIYKKIAKINLKFTKDLENKLRQKVYKKEWILLWDLKSIGHPMYGGGKRCHMGNEIIIFQVNAIHL